MSGPGGPNPPSKSTRLVVLGIVIAVIVLGGAILMLIRAAGGDEPAPQLQDAATGNTQTSTGAGAGTGTNAATSAAASRTIQTQALPPLNIRQVNWDRMLEPGLSGAFLEPVIFSDLTGDGSDEAIVRVRYEGSGSILDYYVYQANGRDLFVLAADGSLSHGQVNLGVAPGSFVVTESVYQPGDPDCCPSRTRSMTYSWSPGLKEFRLTAET